MLAFGGALPEAALVEAPAWLAPPEPRGFLWNDAPGMGGSHDTPAATHLYDTTSVDAGHLGGYPVSLDLLWVGEYQVGILGVWTGWARFSSTLSESFPDIYEVVEVRSKLSG